MRTERPFISLRNATFRLGDRLVFKDTSWVWKEGEQWAIIGGNGSGKSLLGDALRGRLPLVEGELTHHFGPEAGLMAEECIGHVSFEDRRLNVHESVVQSRWNSIEQQTGTTVEQFLSFESVMEIIPFEVKPAHPSMKRRFEKRKREAVEILRIGPLLKNRLLSLSNGETQRVQLARELCRPLRLLILDEPFTGLDAATRQRFRRVLERMMRTRLRVLVLTTHEEDLPKAVTHLGAVRDCNMARYGERRGVLAVKPSVSTPTPSNGPQSVARRTKAVERVAAKENAAEVLRLKNVTVRYGKRTILRGISWTVREGESWALLGPNGSGKTTLLSLLLGDNPQAYSNEVVVLGRQRGTGESIWELKKRIGWVSPEMQVHFDASATALEAVLSGFDDTIGLFRPHTRRERNLAREWLGRFGIAKQSNDPLFTLSAGVQRSVLLARALVKSPRLLVLDEPCQGLDACHRDAFISLVDFLIRQFKVTVICVSHRMEELPRGISHVLRLDGRGEGKVEALKGRTVCGTMNF
ncbi:MAG TPA: ATP-binding cassette domain-containing protein [Candidatus Dormibacteraeota bacterium]|nr:ATP-binding cassette domain-containing protein [Candidatus Dormibacteraeota bacterium]